MNAPRLLQLLDDGARWDAEYGAGLSNHLPMTLCALSRLGADDARLAAHAAGYAARLRAAPPPVAWPAGDPWRERFGDATAAPAYRGLFREWIAAEGPRDVLEQALPALLPGAGAAAFHGLIRTAYAASFAPAEELADALAYWSWRWLPLDGTPPAADTGLLVERMQRAAADPGFDDLLETVDLDEGTLERLARRAAQAYAGSGDFGALHLVTGTQAMRVLMTFADEPLVALADFAVPWTAARALLRATDADLEAAAAAVPLQPWEALVETALHSDDEHLIKLVDACREEEAAWGGDDWRRAAGRAAARASDAR